MKILVTGAHGYIAANLKKHLEGRVSQGRGMSVELVSVRDGNWERVDCRGCDAVIHAAAIVHKDPDKHAKEAYFRVNSALPVEIARKAIDEKVGHFLFFSTMNVHSLKDRRIDRSTRPAPCDRYGASKLAAEDGLHKLFREAGTSCVLSILRPPLVYGPGCPGNFSRFVRLVRLLPLFPKLESLHSMVFIENLCEFVRQLLLHPQEGVFHPQNATYVETAELFGTVAKLLRHPLWLPSVPSALLHGLEILSSGFAKLAGSWTYDMDIDPGFPPESYNTCGFAESMRRTLQTRQSR